MQNSLVVETAKPEVNTAEQTQETSAATNQTQESTVPKKYRGKSLDDVIDMHANAERELGRQRNEIGTWRQTVDELIGAKRTSDLAETESTQQPVEVTSDELLQNPVDAIAQVVNAALDKRLAPIEQDITQTRETTEFSKFTTDFPDYLQVVESEEFATYVHKRPSRVADVQAAMAGDITAARRVMENYSDVLELTNASATTNAQTREENTTLTGVAGARKVATESSGSTESNTGKKVFTQDEVVKLLLSDPSKYRSQAYQDELKLAITEGRYKR